MFSLSVGAKLPAGGKRRVDRKPDISAWRTDWVRRKPLSPWNTRSRSRCGTCLTDDVDYADLGGGYFPPLDPERPIRRIVRQANALGFTVHFDLIQAA